MKHTIYTVLGLYPITVMEHDTFVSGQRTVRKPYIETIELFQEKGFEKATVEDAEKLGIFEIPSNKTLMKKGEIYVFLTEDLKDYL